MPSDAVALYWDFENLHASLVDQRYGAGSYFGSRFRPQEALVDIAGIVEFALSLGPVAINRAFANWASFSRYRVALLEQAVELIQLFQPGSNGKNGADIRLCLDVVEDMVRYPHIGTIVVVGGDSDFMPLSFKVKAAGRTLVGIGALSSTNANWARSCHEFKYYETLLQPLVLKPEVPALASAEARAGSRGAEPEPAADAGAAAVSGELVPVGEPALSGADLELRELLDRAVDAQDRHRDARELVRRAVELLSQRRGDVWVQKAGLRPVIQRMDPTFHESHYGCSNFNELLQNMPDLVETRRGEYDHEVRLKT